MLISKKRSVKTCGLEKGGAREGDVKESNVRECAGQDARGRKLVKVEDRIGTGSRLPAQGVNKRDGQGVGYYID